MRILTGCCSLKRDACNYYCKICRQTDKTPNVLGRFIHKRDTNTIFCTGCKNEFTREELAKVATQEVLYVERELFI